MGGEDNKTLADSETGSLEEKGSSSEPSNTTQAWSGKFDDEWLKAFYAQCGREVTLAYTTLNQMKNWAMLITAAAISALAFGTSAANYPNAEMLVGVVVIYTFTLRFFIRAIICYINLTRWNTIQNSCIRLMLQPTASDPARLNERVKKLEQDIQSYYYRWLSPISRKTQVFANLKLGFALLFALPLFFMVWGILALWDDSLVRGLAFFALGDTIVELNDFGKSRYFDDVKADESKPSRRKLYDIFPAPASPGGFLSAWFVVLVTSIGIAAWPQFWPWLRRLWTALYALIS